MSVIQYQSVSSASHSQSQPEPSPPSEIPQPFRITFANQNKTYFPGETVKGEIIFLWEHRFQAIQGIIARIGCTGEIHHGQRLVDSIFERTYYSKHYFVCGDGVRIHEFRAPSSSREASFPFIFTLPNSGMPQSYSGPHGTVRYFIEAIAKFKASPYSLSSVEQFTVNDYLDLNIDVIRDIVAGPIYQVFDNSSNFITSGLALLLGDSTTFSSFCSSATRRKVITKLNLDKRGFAHGEFIRFKVEIVNETTKILLGSTLEFLQVIRYRAQHMSNDEVNVLGKSDGPVIQSPLDRWSWEGEFEVPADIPVSSASNLMSCITISYKLKIEIETPPLSRNLKYEYPILIGTIPFENIPRRSRSMDFGRPVGAANNNHSAEEGQGHLTFNQLSVDLPSYLDLASGDLRGPSPPPPSYEEAVAIF